MFLGSKEQAGAGICLLGLFVVRHSLGGLWLWRSHLSHCRLFVLLHVGDDLVAFVDDLGVYLALVLHLTLQRCQHPLVLKVHVHSLLDGGGFVIQLGFSIQLQEFFIFNLY